MNNNKITHIQPVTNQTLDSVAESYTLCGWKEIDIIGKTNKIEAIVFEWNAPGIPVYPVIQTGH